MSTANVSCAGRTGQGNIDHSLVLVTKTAETQPVLFQKQETTAERVQTRRQLIDVEAKGKSSGLEKWPATTLFAQCSLFQKGILVGIKPCWARKTIVVMDLKKKGRGRRRKNTGEPIST